MEAIKARVKAHDEQTKSLQHQLDERTTEAVAANKPLKVRVPATLVCLVTPVVHSIARRLNFVTFLSLCIFMLHCLSKLKEAQVFLLPGGQEDMPVSCFHK